mmetsp:Transcript_2257/g.4106  ORF Transcript_2257/g.4106 Transcript_2257/m.4106 type:complete len:336 (-) Transcript_2257:24-1031(-)
MDVTSGIIGNMHVDVKTIEAVICVAVVMVMLRLELFRRATEATGDVSRSAEKYKTLLRECGPEAFSTLACIALVVALRLRGDTYGETMDEGSRQAWEVIKIQWPLLMTADTLLALQAMLRFVVVISLVLRGGHGQTSPLAEDTSMIWLGGAVCRSAVLYVSDAYWLEGPAGGWLPTVCEVALVPLLLLLGYKALLRSSLSALVVVSMVSWFSQRNYLNLAEEHNANVLFTAAHCFEFLAAFAYVTRTMLLDEGFNNRVSCNVPFTHLVMPMQAALGVYFWLQAFAPDADLTGSGLGIQAVQLGCLAQLGAYLGSAALHVAAWFDDQANLRHAHVL